MSQKTKVVFIASWGRNGSSILANVLGTNANCYSVGELKYILHRGVKENRLCGCGDFFKNCSFWEKVLLSLGWDNGALKKEKFIENIDYFCKKRYFFLGLVKCWRSKKREGIAEDLAKYSLLYREISNTSKCQVIIDSSKNPMIARWLIDEKNIDLYVVHLTRDPRASAFSHKTKTRQIDHIDTPYLRQLGIMKSSYVWFIYNLGAWLLFKNSNKYLHLKYEDFCNYPLKTIEKVMNFIHQPVSIHDELTPNQVSIEMSHTVSGNPSRFSYGQVVIQEDEKWLENLSWFERFFVSLITFPLMMKYGYGFFKRKN